MKSRLGIAVGAREIRAIIVQHHSIRWHASVHFRGIHSLSAAIAELFAETAPLPMYTCVVVGVAPAWVQLKPLHGLPLVRSVQLATNILREHQHAIFLAIGRAMVVTDVHMASDGTNWGAAFERDMVGEITRALRDRQIPVTHIVPSVVALAAAFPAAFPGRGLSWSDGMGSFYMEGDRTGLRRFERIAADGDRPHIELPAQLAALGDDAARFVDAWALATAPRPLSTSWQPEPDRRRTRMLTIRSRALSRTGTDRPPARP